MLRTDKPDMPRFHWGFRISFK